MTWLGRAPAIAINLPTLLIRNGSCCMSGANNVFRMKLTTVLRLYATLANVSNAYNASVVRVMVTSGVLGRPVRVHLPPPPAVPHPLLIPTPRSPLGSSCVGL